MRKQDKRAFQLVRATTMLTQTSAFLALCPLSITITLENRVGQADSQLCLVEHNVDPAPLLATTPGEDSDDIVPIIRTLSETDAWYDQGPRKRKIMNTQAWVRSQAFPTTFEGVTIDTHVTSLGGPMPKDMFPVYNNPQAAPQNGDPSNSQGSTRVKLDKAKGKRPIFELAEDPSPPESLMIQRE
ncbi:hypothetical protein EV356DRAFT_508592 [Viridothelium virens]|uniref:Uncharacterized protein n=1 Tax=Viridothelium virens TaxID=1048519 RepID=A0A6A6HKG8_VIRVR|nr:hypothetical protein EV356DRAFT_508592 [Viridothelium virens]